jgi:TonB family protein
MNLRLPLLLGATALLLAPAVVHAQKALYVEHDGQFHLVRRVVRSDPYVENGKGKLVPASGSRYVLADVKEYAPFYVSVRNLKVSGRHLNLVGSGAEINHEFSFKADFESAYPLENVFVVLDMNTEDAGKTLFVREVGDLEPHDYKPVEITVRLSDRLGGGKYRLHLFSKGAEVFQSELPFNVIEAKLDQMVRRRIAGVEDAGPRPFVGPAPEYPPKLRRAKTKGEAIIRFSVSANGRVLNPQIKSATDPAFGDAALVAARQWRFLPRVIKGAPVTTTVDMPFIFGPPEPKPEATVAP